MRRPYQALAVWIFAQELELPPNEVPKFIAGRLIIH